MSTALKHFYEFGPFCVDLTERQLRRGGRVVPLTPKVFDTLLVFLESRGRTLKKDELMQRLWPDSFVEESSLAQNVFQLRKALGKDDSEEYIATIQKRGYHFIPEVREVNGAETKLGLGRETARFGEGLGVRSLAVLPFKPLGADRNDELLGLGMADALIIKLNELKQIQVLPTSAIFRYSERENNPLTAGRELSVDAVLDGTVQHADDQVRVTVQLMRVVDGQILWSRKFDEHFTNIFEVQDSISEQVAKSLALRITFDVRTHLTKRYTQNTEAYQTYLVGLYFWNKRTKEGVNTAIEYFEHTIANDPNFALAYAGLADCYFLNLSFGYEALQPALVYEKVRATALRALELDPTLAEPHVALAVVKIRQDRDPAGAEVSFDRAIAANPNCAMAYLRYAWFLAAMGRLEEALQNAERAQELDPLSPENNATVGYFLYFARQYDKAIGYCQRALLIEPDFFGARLYAGLNYLQKGMYEEAISEYRIVGASHKDCTEPLELLGHAYAVMGRRDEAEKVLSQLEELSAHKQVLPYNLASIYAALNQNDRAFELLEQPWVIWTERLRVLRFDPRLDNLRSDLRFENLIVQELPMMT
jgi:DNA-binding winged helix-turn-helix (wHTH) protein/TolB-like protein/Tfp pilus assembly protein PilF